MIPEFWLERLLSRDIGTCRDQRMQMHIEDIHSNSHIPVSLVSIKLRITSTYVPCRAVILHLRWCRHDPKSIVTLKKSVHPRFWDDERNEESIPRGLFLGDTQNLSD